MFYIRDTIFFFRPFKSLTSPIVELIRFTKIAVYLDRLNFSITVSPSLPSSYVHFLVLCIIGNSVQDGKVLYRAWSRANSRKYFHLTNYNIIIIKVKTRKHCIINNNRVSYIRDLFIYLRTFLKLPLCALEVAPSFFS